MTSSILTAHYQLESADADALSNFLSKGAKGNGSRNTSVVRRLVPVFLGVLIAGMIIIKAGMVPPSTRYGATGAGMLPVMNLVAGVGPLVFLMAFWFFLTSPASYKTRLLRLLGLLLAFTLFAGLVVKAQMAAPHSYRYSHAGASNSPLVSLVSLLLPMVLLVAFWWFILSTSRKAQSKLPILQNPSTFTLSADGVQLSYNPTTTQTAWSGIERVAQTPTHLFLFDQPRSAFIVPRRAFASDEEFALFGDFARAHCEAAKPILPPIAGV